MAVNSSSSQVISLLYDGNSSVKDHRPENMTEDTRNLAQRHGNHNNTRNIGHRHDNNRTSPRSNVSAEDGERKIVSIFMSRAKIINFCVYFHKISEI